MLIYPLSYFSKQLKIIKFLGTSPNSVKQTEVAVKQTMANKQYSYIPTIFLLHIDDLPDDVICNIAIYSDDTTLYSKCDQASDMQQQLELASKLESDLRETGLGQEVAC